MMHCRNLLILVASLMLGAGCSSDRSLPLAPAMGVPMAAPGLDSRSATIGPLGGVIVNGNVRLDVPAGALSGTVRIVLGKRADGSVDLTPDGLAFVLPATLTFTLAEGTNPAVCGVEGFDSSGAWVTVPSAPVEMTIVAPVGQFSIYHIVEYE